MSVILFAWWCWVYTNSIFISFCSCWFYSIVVSVGCLIWVFLLLLPIVQLQYIVFFGVWGVDCWIKIWKNARECSPCSVTSCTRAKSNMVVRAVHRHRKGGGRGSRILWNETSLLFAYFVLCPIKSTQIDDMSIILSALEWENIFSARNSKEQKGDLKIILLLLTIVCTTAIMGQ